MWEEFLDIFWYLPLTLHPLALSTPLNNKRPYKREHPTVAVVSVVVEYLLQKDFETTGIIHFSRVICKC